MIILRKLMFLSACFAGCALPAQASFLNGIKTTIQEWICPVVNTVSRGFDASTVASATLPHILWNHTEPRQGHPGLGANHPWNVFTRESQAVWKPESTPPYYDCSSQGILLKLQDGFMQGIYNLQDSFMQGIYNLPTRLWNACLWADEYRYWILGLGCLAIFAHHKDAKELKEEALEHISNIEQKRQGIDGYITHYEYKMEETLKNLDARAIALRENMRWILKNHENDQTNLARLKGAIATGNYLSPQKDIERYIDKLLQRKKPLLDYMKVDTNPALDQYIATHAPFRQLSGAECFTQPSIEKEQYQRYLFIASKIAEHFETMIDNFQARTQYNQSAAPTTPSIVQALSPVSMDTHPVVTAPTPHQNPEDKRQNLDTLLDQDNFEIDSTQEISVPLQQDMGQNQALIQTQAPSQLKTLSHQDKEVLSKICEEALVLWSDCAEHESLDPEIFNTLRINNDGSVHDTRNPNHALCLCAKIDSLLNFIRQKAKDSVTQDLRDDKERIKSHKALGHHTQENPHT